MTDVTPYKVNIREGAQAYNRYGMIPWGIIPDAFRFNAQVVATGIDGDKVRINDPLWNGREWCVKEADTTKVIETPPEPTIHVTHTILVYSDGSISVDGSFIPVS